MREALSTKQSQLVDFIRAFTARTGISPTYAEMAKHFGVNVTSTHQMVDVLIRKGYVRCVRGVSRGLILTDYADLELPDINDEEYWCEGVFKPHLYQRDVIEAIKSAGMKVKEPA